MEKETLKACSTVERNEGVEDNEVERRIDDVVEDEENESVMEKQNDSERNNGEDKVEEPKIDMSFDSADEILEYYRKYGKQMGFNVCKISLRRENGVPKYTTIGCSRSGNSNIRSNKILRPYPITKTKCQARINAKQVIDGKWQVSSVVLDHNHVLSPGKSRFFRRNRVIKNAVKRRLELNANAGIRLNKSFYSLAVEAGGYENLEYLEKDCRNYVDKVLRLKLGEGDASALQSYFMHVQDTDSSFFYLMDLNEENRLRNLFWADGRQRAAYEEFGDVITFDTTYLTNKYDMPFAPFVGVNHHGQSILFGCGLLSSEDTETFTWMFRAWLSCMSNRAPNAIITDQDRAMQNAVEIVFPNARHRWCLWHIMKKIPEKLSSYNQYKSITFFLNDLVYESLTPNEFEMGWNKMIENFSLEKNEWLNGLYNERYRWVPCLVKDCFWAGMSTTQRSESMNAFFDGYVNSKTSLKQFVEQYENALRSKAEKENNEDFISFNSWVPTVTPYAMEKQIQQVYTTTKFREFQNELTGMMHVMNALCIGAHGAISQYKVADNRLVGERIKKTDFIVYFTKEEGEKECDVKCSCRLFEFRGILCRHALRVLIMESKFEIPSKYIVRRWRKDIKWRHTKVKVRYSDWGATPAGYRYNNMCNAFFDVANIASEFEYKCDLVIERIGDLKKEVTKDDGVCGSSFGTPHSKSTDSGKPMSKGSKNIRTPLAVRGKGRPPCKRKQSKVEQIINRKRKGKKENSSTDVSQMVDLEDHMSYLGSLESQVTDFAVSSQGASYEDPSTTSHSLTQMDSIRTSTLNQHFQWLPFTNLSSGAHQMHHFIYPTSQNAALMDIQRESVSSAPPLSQVSQARHIDNQCGPGA